MHRAAWGQGQAECLHHSRAGGERRRLWATPSCADQGSAGPCLGCSGHTLLSHIQGRGKSRQEDVREELKRSPEHHPQWQQSSMNEAFPSKGV